MSTMLSLGLKLAVTPKSEVPGNDKNKRPDPSRMRGERRNNISKHDSAHLEVYAA